MLFFKIETEMSVSKWRGNSPSISIYNNYIYSEKIIITNKYII